MAKYINADALVKRIDDELCKPCRDEKQDYNGVRCRACWVDYMLLLIDSEPEVTANVRDVIEADGYKHLICPHCLSEFYAKTKAEMFCPDCGKKLFYYEKQQSIPYRGDE